MGFVHDELLAIVHTPVTISDAMHMTAAKAAMDNAWQAFRDNYTWEVAAARERNGEFVQEARQQGRIVYCGQVVPLCDNTHRQLLDAQRTYKGRAVLSRVRTSDDADDLSRFLWTGHFCVAHGIMENAGRYSTRSGHGRSRS